MTTGTAGLPAGRPLDAVSTVCRNIGIVLLAVMSVLIIAQVVGRNLFNIGMPWADELARFCGVSLVFLGVPILALRGQQVAVDMVPMLLPPGGRRVLAFASETMILAFACISLWALYSFLGRAGKFATPTLGISNWIFYAPSTIAFALLALITTARLTRLLRSTDSGETDPS